jgi:hypothetical protein
MSRDAMRSLLGPRMNPTPMSRDTMRSLKATVEEEARQAQIQKIVSDIYLRATVQAQLTTNSLYTYPVPLTAQSCNRGINQYAPCDFHTKNMPDILLRLREIFPGCVVKFSLLVKGKDGKMYDVDTMHEEALPFIDMKDSNEFITIDWS